VDGERSRFRDSWVLLPAVVLERVELGRPEEGLVWQFEVLAAVRIVLERVPQKLDVGIIVDRRLNERSNIEVLVGEHQSDVGVALGHVLVDLLRPVHPHRHRSLVRDVSSQDLDVQLLLVDPSSLHYEPQVLVHHESGLSLGRYAGFVCSQRTLN